MPRQGQGNGTPRKEEGFYTLFLTTLRVTKNKPFPHWHLDLNAGSGHNELADCEGSPVVFLRAAIEVARPAPVHCLFCDIDEGHIVSLRAACFGVVEQLADGSSVSACALDNATFLGRASEAIREAERRPDLATGTVLCDPNGFPDGCPVDALDAFLAEHPRMDLILNLNVSLFARVRGCLKSEREAIRKGFLDWPTLAQLVGRFHKEHWFIRNPSRGPRERFVTFYGHNNPAFGGSKFMDFFPLHSPAGQTVLHSLQRVNPEQGLLFEDME